MQKMKWEFTWCIFSVVLKLVMQFIYLLLSLWPSVCYIVIFVESVSFLPKWVFSSFPNACLLRTLLSVSSNRLPVVHFIQWLSSYNVQYCLCTFTSYPQWIGHLHHWNRHFLSEIVSTADLGFGIVIVSMRPLCTNHKTAGRSWSETLSEASLSATMFGSTLALPLSFQSFSFPVSKGLHQRATFFTQPALGVSCKTSAPVQHNRATGCWL